jgi:hypothetical protein
MIRSNNGIIDRIMRLDVKVVSNPFMTASVDEHKKLEKIINRAQSTLCNYGSPSVRGVVLAYSPTDTKEDQFTAIFWANPTHALVVTENKLGVTIMLGINSAGIAESGLLDTLGCDMSDVSFDEKVTSRWL